MSNEEQKNRQDFLNAIRNYQYITDGERLLLEPFCVYLSHCFGFDGILEKSPQPRDMYMLLIDLIREMLGNESAPQYVQLQPIAGWTPDMAYIYPERTMTCIHVSALAYVSYEWIYQIGHYLMQIPEPAEPSKYFDWVDEEWVAVHGFINGYHNAFSSFQKEFDREGIRDRGYSLFEALYLSKHRNIDFDGAVEILKERHDSYQAALTRIEESIANRYFLEAIALEECLISNCLFNYLGNTGTRLTNPSFKLLLTAIRKNSQSFDGSTMALFKKIDDWRVDRNKSIHGFITTASDSLSQSRQSFQKLTETTAKEGEILCESVVSWYELECVNFIPHQFPSRVVAH
ncbi:hypothetical protein HOP54_07695 [Halomonas daqingensis]|uniref:hypothetical protein n=1 Tax=Billgrantia desiderata TaxID=52021 RepID=UPI001F1ECD87|nr:hypothetical protein [Halomonas desiderata]MCE8014290.1 hypothetical protein [Halomonas desiderata]MCE8028566.1 hypothetical protein [Halomonas desiderata]